MFTNTCLHSGDKNDSNQYCLQLFAYLVSDPLNFPQNKVMLYDWTDTMENARIKTPSQVSEKTMLERIKESNFNKEQLVKGRVLYETERYGFL
jgi:hypothetical protein